MSSDIPEKMTVIAISEPGGPEVLQPEERNVPTAMPGEILIKIEAAGVNRPDIAQRRGHYPPPKGASELPGLEISGTVVKTGREATRFKTGDKVCALTNGGGYAQFCTVNETSALAVPAGLSMIEAAALPETFFTVWHNVFERGALKAGETFLVHGGTSGIGTTAIQLARAFGAEAFATAGSEEKCKFCEKIGARRGINYLEEDYPDVIMAETDGVGAHVILDMVGGDYIERNYKAAAIEGRIVQIAFLGGPQADVNFTRLMIKRLTHTGSTLRPRSDEFKGRIAAILEEKVWPLIEAGTVRPVMDSTFPLAEAAAAHARMETSKHIGKIMLEVS